MIIIIDALYVVQLFVFYFFCVYVTSTFCFSSVHRTCSGAFKDKESPNSRRSHSRRREQTPKEEKGWWKMNQKIMFSYSWTVLYLDYYGHMHLLVVGATGSTAF